MSTPPPTAILVVQTAFLGDLVLTQPLVEELSRAFAPARVDLLVRAPFADLARGFRGVGEVLPFDKRGVDRGLGGLVRQRLRIKDRRYRMVVSPHGSLRTGVLLAWAGIPRRIGFDGKPAAPFFTERIPQPTGPYPERLRRLLLAAGAGPGNDDPRLDVSLAAETSLAAKLTPAGVRPNATVVAINPGSVWGTKRWIPEGYAAVCVELINRGWTPVLVGSKDDAPVAAEVVRISRGKVVDLSGKTTLPELAALAKRSKVFVSGDSGPMHIAAAVGVPVVAIFGPTTTDLGFAPRTKAAEIVQRALECRPCHKHGLHACPLGHFRCMREIPATDVLAAIGRLTA